MEGLLKTNVETVGKTTKRLNEEAFLFLSVGINMLLFVVYFRFLYFALLHFFSVRSLALHTIYLL